VVDTNGIDPDDAKRKRKGNRDDDYLLAVAEAKLLIEAQEALGTPAKIAATTVLGILKASYAWVSNLEARLDGPGNFDFYLYASPGEKVKNDYKLRPGFKPSSNNLTKEQWKKEYSDYRRNTRNGGSYDGMDKEDVEAIEKSLNQHTKRENGKFGQQDATVDQTNLQSSQTTTYTESTSKTKKELENDAPDLTKRALPQYIELTEGPNFIDHFRRHRKHLKGLNGKTYRTDADGGEFLEDLHGLIKDGKLKYVGDGELTVGQGALNIFRG
jgi:hypothetical protein